MNKIMRADIDAINEIVRSLLGQMAWNVKLGVGSFITMEFGAPINVAGEKTRGEWYLWIYCCGWYLENPGSTFIGSEDPREILEHELAVLEGRRLNAVEISSTAFETIFVFERGLALHTFPLNFIDPCEYWMLFTPDGKVLVLGPATKWSFEISSESGYQP